MLAFTLAIAAPVLVAWASHGDMRFRALASDRGLAQNTVTAFAQDADGFVWVGTQGGLHRYDGQRYHLFRHDPRDPGSLPDSYVSALAVEGRDTLWIGTYSEYVARLDLRDGRIQRFAPPATDGSASPGRRVLALLPIDGQVWIGTGARLVRFDPATGRTQAMLTLDPRAVAALSLIHI